MFDTIWQNRKAWQETRLAAERFESLIAAQTVHRMAVLHWEEHCLECFPPVCYQQCPLYVARPDRKCARLVYGICADKRFRGPTGYGAGVKFRRWGKLETRFYPRMVRPATLRWLDRLNRLLSAATKSTSKLLAGLSPQMRLVGLLNYLRELLLLRACGNVPARFDAFLLECYSLEPAPYHLILRCRGTQGPYFEHSFEVKPGRNLFELRREQMHFPHGSAGSYIMLFPENNLEACLVLLWCDFVSYRASALARNRPTLTPAEVTGSQKPEIKVKCVCWDLDNTVWEGILLEDGADRIAVRPELRDLIKQLDKRGILQSIVSKNDHEQAWAVIEREGLQDYFLYPAINWNPKSDNLRKIATRLNLGIDTLVLVDDSAFERAEVVAAQPLVRVYSAAEAGKLLSYGEFNVPITTASAGRRLTYLAQIQRERVQQESGLDPLEFLRQCQMVLEIAPAKDELSIQRCWELCQRSNQLNLSTRHYSEGEFRALLAAAPESCFALRCRDRFGDYGIVGFASVHEPADGEAAELAELVISCRVARKRVEHTLIQWVARREYERGKRRLRACFIKTEKNGPMGELFQSLPFRALLVNGQQVLYEMALHNQLVLDDYLTVLASG